MPIPKPNSGEGNEDFIDRCMSDNTMVNEYPDQDQRSAVCNAQLGKQLKNNTMKSQYNIENGLLHPAKKKNLKFAVKDVDMAKRTIAAYYAVFGNKDLDGDITDPTAFNRTIKQRGPAGTDEIAHLKNHIITDTPGRVKSLETDNVGAFFVSKISESSLGKDTLIEYQEGIIKQHSFGYDVINEEKEADGNHLKELKLYEVSSLNFLGANPLTSVISITKNLKTEADYIKAVDLLNNYLKIGSFSDNLLKKVKDTLKTVENMKTKQKEEKIVNCASCGFAFDYNGLPEQSLDQMAKEELLWALRWITSDAAYEIAQEQKEEIKENLQSIIDGSKTKSIENIKYVKCPKCYHAVFGSDSSTQTKQAPVDNHAKTSIWGTINNNL